MGRRGSWRAFGAETGLPLPPGLVTEEQCVARVAAAEAAEQRTGFYRAIGVGIIALGVGIALRGFWR